MSGAKTTNALNVPSSNLIFFLCSVLNFQYKQNVDAFVNRDRKVARQVVKNTQPKVFSHLSTKERQRERERESETESESERFVKWGHKFVRQAKDKDTFSQFTKMTKSRSRVAHVVYAIFVVQICCK